MVKNNLSRIILISSALLLPLNISLFGDAASKPAPREIIILQQPESELSKALAGAVTFGTDGIRTVFKPLFVTSEKAKKHLEDGENIEALKTTVFRGLIIVIPPLMSIVLLGGAKIGIKLIKRELFNPKPTILNKAQNPRYGYIDRLKERLAPKPIQKMVFNDEIAHKLSDIVKKTIMLQKLIKMGKKRTYANLLLHGNPGTGKTLFAQTLAQKTNMDFLPVTAASLLQKGVEGIKYFDELIDMANRSPYGTIIFIDEADGLFIDRNLLNPDSDHYKVLEHILSVIDGSSNKYMIVAATNRAHILDRAMNRRFQDQIEMPLPDAAARKKLLELYTDKILFNEKETSKSFVDTTRGLFTAEYIETIVQMTAGLSHAEIADMIEAVRNKAELCNRAIEITDVENAIHEAMVKHNNNKK